MTYAILVGVIVLVGGGTAWRMRCPKVVDDDYQQRLSEYNRECRLIKIDYRNGMFPAEAAMKKLESIGERLRIPPPRRTKSLGAIQLKRE